MRRVTDPYALREAIEAAAREAEAAFGDPTVFLEQAACSTLAANAETEDGRHRLRQPDRCHGDRQ